MKLSKLAIIWMFCVVVTEASYADNEKFSKIYNDANNAFTRGQVEEATGLYKKALSLASTTREKVVAIGGMASLYDQTCQYGKSKVSTENILTIDPDNNWALGLMQELDKKIDDNKICNRLIPLSKYAKEKIAFRDRIDELFNSEMSFHFVGTCAGSSCPEYILAIGKISSRTPDRLKEAIQEYGLNNIVLHSPGGDLLGGLLLGEVIRDNNMSTHVISISSDTTFYDTETNNDWAYGEVNIINKAVCFSSCAYAFLGGIERNVSGDSAYGVHQFYSESNLAKQSDTQNVVGSITLYLTEMGINRDLIQLALLTDSEEMWVLDEREMEILGVVTTVRTSTGEWSLEPADDGNIFVHASASGALNNRRDIHFFLFKDHKGYTGMVRVDSFREDKDRTRKRVLGCMPSNHLLDVYTLEISIGGVTHKVIVDPFVSEKSVSYGAVFEIPKNVTYYLGQGEKLTVSWGLASVCRDVGFYNATFPNVNQMSAIRSFMQL